jgi:hypothetical protein
MSSSKELMIHKLNYWLITGKFQDAQISRDRQRLKHTAPLPSQCFGPVSNNTDNTGACLYSKEIYMSYHKETIQKKIMKH